MIENNFRFLTLDFETYFDKDYSLRKMSNLEYIRDPRFEIYGAALKRPDQEAAWLDQREFTNWCRSFEDWNKTAVISHNSLFDLGILFECFDIRPGFRIDTLGLCRALLSHDLNFDLDTITPLLGGPKKLDDGDPLQQVKGHRWKELEDSRVTNLGKYAKRDADMAEHIFKVLWPELPDAERDFMNLILRISTEGRLRFDHKVAQQARDEIEADRQAKIKAAGVPASVLRSRDKFAAELEKRGVEPPTKITYTKKHPEGAVTWAFSKTQDPEFVALQAHPDVGSLVQARLATSSNNAITRIDRLLTITSMEPYTLPVQLKYNGAHTGRLAGAGSINMQNLNARGVGAGLRKAITAPPGSVIVVMDQSGIELRLNMWFSGQYNVLELIRQGGDPYVQQAAAQFKLPEEECDKNTPDGSTRRNYGKVVELGCGFGMGWRKFKANAAIGPMGTEPRYLTNGQAYETIQTYRASRPYVKASWDWLGHVAIPTMTDPKANIKRGPVTIKHECIELPGGMTLKYPNLAIGEDGEWQWGMNGVHHRPYGGILQENIVQALAGKLIKDNMLEIERRWGDDCVVHQVHDEILCVVAEDKADEMYTLMEEVMTTVPSWAPDMPLDVEGGYSYRYEK